MDSKRTIELAMLGLVAVVAIAGAFLMNSTNSTVGDATYSQGHYGYAYNQPIGDCFRATGQGTQKVYLYSMDEYNQAKNSQFLLSQCKLYSVY